MRPQGTSTNDTGDRTFTKFQNLRTQTSPQLLVCSYWLLKPSNQPFYVLSWRTPLSIWTSYRDLPLSSTTDFNWDPKSNTRVLYSKGSPEQTGRIKATGAGGDVVRHCAPVAKVLPSLERCTWESRWKKYESAAAAAAKCSEKIDIPPRISNPLSRSKPIIHKIR